VATPEGCLLIALPKASELLPLQQHFTFSMD